VDSVPPGTTDTSGRGGVFSTIDLILVVGATRADFLNKFPMIDGDLAVLPVFTVREK
jgi:hypothetical protein